MLTGTLHLPTDPRSEGPGGREKRTSPAAVVSGFHLSVRRVPGTLPHAPVHSMGKTRKNISSLFPKDTSYYTMF